VSPLLLPPTFEPVIVPGDAFGAAVEAAQRQADIGNFFWANTSSPFDVAIILEPDLPLSRAWPAPCAAMLAMAEALDAIGPPNLAVAFSWPDAVVVNDATVGGIRTAFPPAAALHGVPEWMVVGLSLRWSFPGNIVPGLLPEQTALVEEGFDVTATELGEAFARSLMGWIDRWTEAGPEPVAARWLARLAPASAPCGLDPVSGALLGPGSGSTRMRFPPSAGVRPTWSLNGWPPHRSPA
jgi:BirA family transcriptional regulator, biotin operon repressor / biotin---[acetyl-CoA-carboxylase] ligase